jgi:hypothetical protein
MHVDQAAISIVWFFLRDQAIYGKLSDNLVYVTASQTSHPLRISPNKWAVREKVLLLT